MASKTSAGRTAYGAAAIRAAEMFVPEPQRLFDDPLILSFLPAASRFAIRRRWIREWFLALFERQAPGIRGALLSRTCAIDDAVNAAVGRGVRVAVILGAGLDTRPYRLRSLATANVFELDLPRVQAFKKKRLLAIFGQIPVNVRFIPTDFSTERLDVTLTNAGLDRNQPAIFVWEGVTQYLPAAAVESVLRTIAAWAKGSELVFTYVLDEVISRNFRPDRSEAFRKSASIRPEPWHFGLDPEKLESFLKERGLTLEDDVGAEEHLARYIRPLGRDLAVSEIERVVRASVD
jgi:methyltransferase (TIGR00027 family)